MNKICFLIGDINHSGGTERVTNLISNELADKGYDVSILSISGGKHPFFETHKNIKTYNVFEKKSSMKIHALDLIFKIRKFLINNKINTLIVVDSISCIFTIPACNGMKINHICWEHFNLKVNLGSSFRNLGRWMAAKWCDKIITLTERDKSFWDNKFHLNNKVLAISNPSPYPIQNNVPSLDDKRILCVGRLTDQKGFDLLIPAWAKIIGKVSEWKIIIVGAGEDEHKLKKMAEDYNLCSSLEFVGQQKDMDKFYRSSSFFCMSSRFEGLPMVLLEAQSYGLPIVSFDCDTGPAELIKHQYSGLLATNGDVDSLAAKIYQMINLKPEEFERYSKTTFETSRLYASEKIINSWIEIV